MINKKKCGIILGIDNKDIEQSISLIKETHDYIDMVKLGLEFFIANGISGVKTIQEKTGMPIFLDLKLFDIPNTVKGAIESIIENCKVQMVTIHLSGGKEMLQAAVKANHTDWLTLVGVTILTSIKSSLEDIMNLVDIGHSSSITTVVCSALEVSSIKSKYKEIKTIVPGIRIKGQNNNDQQRTADPIQAVKNGADFLVIGRSITTSIDPKKTAFEIAEAITNIK